MKHRMKIILASASPRRKELLEQIGIPFEVLVSHVEEKVTSVRPGQVVEELSGQKAEAVLGLLEEGDALVIAADTVVALEGRILGKPADTENAVEMLRSLAGKTHQVYTGVTLLYRRGEETARKVFHEKTKVHFYPMTEEEIRSYAASGEPPPSEKKMPKGEAMSNPIMQITSTTTITTQPPAAMAAISSCMAAMAAFIAATVAFAVALAVTAAAFAVARAVCTARWVAFTVAWADLWAVLTVCWAVFAVRWVVLMAFLEECSAVLMVWWAVRSVVFRPERAVLMILCPPSRTGRVSGSPGLTGLRTVWAGMC